MSRPGLSDLAERLGDRVGAGALRRRLEGHLYRGDAVECPCCGGRFRRFAPYARRRDARCPACGAMERHRLLWLFLRERTDLFERPQRLLHFAPEAVFRRHLSARPGLHYVSADLSPGRAALRCDIRRIPLADASFDALLCNHVLEHVPDDRRAMAELCRVLRPGGWAILQVPIRSALEQTLEAPPTSTPREREHLFGQSDHLRQYGPDYAERLRAAGFEVSLERFDRAVGKERCLRHGLKREAIHFCRRP